MAETELSWDAVATTIATVAMLDSSIASAPFGTSCIMLDCVAPRQDVTSAAHANRIRLSRWDNACTCASHATRWLATCFALALSVVS